MADNYGRSRTIADKSRTIAPKSGQVAILLDSIRDPLTGVKTHQLSAVFSMRSTAFGGIYLTRQWSNTIKKAGEQRPWP
jgi:hypothetical protein